MKLFKLLRREEKRTIFGEISLIIGTDIWYMQAVPLKNCSNRRFIGLELSNGELVISLDRGAHKRNEPYLMLVHATWIEFSFEMRDTKICSSAVGEKSEKLE